MKSKRLTEHEIMAIIVPGILTADEDDYQKRLALAEHSAGLVQIDVVDGIFANNKTVGVETIKKYSTRANLEIQLMVVEPSGFIDELISVAWVSKIIFPLETDELVNANIYRVKNHHKQVGISLNPDTPIEKAALYADDIDVLLLMTGKPGFSGQKLGEETYARIEQARKLMPTVPVEVDIGVNFENAPLLARAGADFLVASSALYGASDFHVAFEKLAKAAVIAS